MNKSCPTSIPNFTRIPHILPTTKRSTILVVDCIITCIFPKAKVTSKFNDTQEKKPFSNPGWGSRQPFNAKKWLNKHWFKEVMHMQFFALLIHQAFLWTSFSHCRILKMPQNWVFSLSFDVFSWVLSFSLEFEVLLFCFCCYSSKLVGYLD